MRKFFLAVPIIALAIGGSTACATKKFVRTSVGEVNDKVDSLGKSVEETQERTKQNAAKITDVDQRAQSGITQAKGAADQASTTANNAMAMAENVDNKFDAFDKSNRRLVFEVVLSEDSGNFKFGKTDLPEAAKMQIDDMVQHLKMDPKNVWIEIEGHTDNVGPKDVNQKIGLERAQAVERYLYEQYQIPLHKMNVISYGEDKPVAPNTTKAGRAQNRRVVIKVLA
jgi:outer membrane protein OmpA-like peptidoglycan-associated protein